MCCSFREAEGETQDDSAAATTTTPPSVLLSDKDPAAAPSQLTPLVRTNKQTVIKCLLV